MSDNTAEVIVILFLVFLAILFGGEPDLMDGIIHFLMKE